MGFRNVPDPRTLRYCVGGITMNILAFLVVGFLAWLFFIKNRSL